MNAEPPELPPSVYPGSTWCWEPLHPDARCTVRITDTNWNGEEWWIIAKILDGPDAGVLAGNTLDRWTEATVLVSPAPRRMQDLLR